VTQQELKFAEIRSRLQQIDGEGMSQTVGTGLLGQAGAPGSQGYGLADGLSAQRLLRTLSWEKPFLRSNLAPISA
jgi:hypothetical protein